MNQFLDILIEKIGLRGQSSSQRFRCRLTDIGCIMFYRKLNPRIIIPNREKSRPRPNWLRETEFVSYNSAATSALRSSESCSARNIISGCFVSSRSNGSRACNTTCRTFASGLSSPHTRTSNSSFVSFADSASVTWSNASRASFETAGTNNKISKRLLITSTRGRSTLLTRFNLTQMRSYKVLLGRQWTPTQG